jgi:hypothetical protein
MIYILMEKKRLLEIISSSLIFLIVGYMLYLIASYGFDAFYIINYNILLIVVLGILSAIFIFLSRWWAKVTGIIFSGLNVINYLILLISALKRGMFLLDIWIFINLIIIVLIVLSIRREETPIKKKGNERNRFSTFGGICLTLTILIMFFQFIYFYYAQIKFFLSLQFLYPVLWGLVTAFFLFFNKDWAKVSAIVFFVNFLYPRVINYFLFFSTGFSSFNFFIFTYFLSDLLNILGLIFIILSLRRSRSGEKNK